MLSRPLFFIWLVLISSVAFAGDDEAPLRTELNEQVLMLPIKIGSQMIELETTLYKPNGPGPFPLLVINHGKDLGETSLQSRSRFPALAKEFLKRGYIVALPMRRGFSKSGGSYTMDNPCGITQYLRDSADDVTKVIELLRARTDVDGQRILVIGQSLGGFVSLAQAERSDAGVKAIISIAGGIYWPEEFNNICDLQAVRDETYTNLGLNAKVDSLWFHGENDPYNPAGIFSKLHERYQAAGGRAVFIRYDTPQYATHGLLETRQSFDSIWWPKAEPFLKAHNLPTKVINQQYVDPPAPKASGYADNLRDVTLLPTEDEGCRDLYRKFLDDYAAPRAFAVSVKTNGQGGGCGWAANSYDPSFYALKRCEKAAKQPCQLYLIDNVIVWPKPDAASSSTNNTER
ncbi:alpha/beta hydrolase family protein [Chitinibacter tainanensis]|uniref:alpha/beta hydrolase family protein n=1 Tax=Chitinibacter tainanensis TaxID=230667 RepID=UPI0003F65A1B|nr:alpha/beta fold hydrolase [Chitinibacter tainanensis]